MRSKQIWFVLTTVILTWSVTQLFARLHRRSVELALQRAREEINTLNCMLNQFQYQ